jgi:hypothetical protein
MNKLEPGRKIGHPAFTDGAAQEEFEGHNVGQYALDEGGQRV